MFFYWLWNWNQQNFNKVLNFTLDLQINLPEFKPWIFNPIQEKIPEVLNEPQSSQPVEKILEAEWRLIFFAQFLLADCKEIYVHNYIDLLLCNETRIGGGAWKDGIPNTWPAILTFLNMKDHFLLELLAASTPNRTLRKRRVFSCPISCSRLLDSMAAVANPKLKAIKQIRTRKQSRWDLHPDYLASNSYHGSAKWMKIGNIKMNFLYNEVIFQVDDQRKGSFTNLWHAGWTAVFNNIFLRGSQKLTTRQRENAPWPVCDDPFSDPCIINYNHRYMIHNTFVNVNVFACKSYLG